jgi:uncharacterized Ntn-hydrolase superfamily protein
VTYSLVARDARTGELGVAVQSHWFGVGSVVPHLRAGVGAVATQSVPDPVQGARVLDLLAEGVPPDAAIDAVLHGDEGVDYRQLAAVDATGRVAVHTGPGCMADAGHTTGEGWSVQANMMSSAEVWPAMAEAFTAAFDEGLAERLVAALEAAEAVGGDVRGRQSAAVVVAPAPGAAAVHPVDLRVEDHDDPVGELRRLVVLRRAYAAAEAGDEAMAEGRLDDAGAHYEEAYRLAPGKPELAFWAGLAAVQRGDRVGGLERVRLAIAANPGLGRLLERLPEEVAPAAPGVRAALRPAD